MTVASARTEPRLQPDTPTADSIPIRSRVARLWIAGAVLAMLLVGTVAQAEDSEPAYRLEIGGEERVRTENWENLSDFDDDLDDTRHQWRFRTRVWSNFHIGARHTFAIGLNNESRKLTTPDTEFSWDEVVFETLYFESKIASATTIRVGRQNVARDDGWLVFEGGPLDGSRTGYFNALDATYEGESSKLQLLVVSDPSTDEYLPRLNDKDKRLIEWDELAAGLAYTNTGLAATEFQGYWYWKRESDDFRAESDPQRQPDRDLHTLGGRFERQLPHGWSLMVDVAGQMGSQDPDSDIRAWGSEASLEKTFAHATKPLLGVSWVGLSGDDPGSADNEGWDPLFARWPKWSELYLYTLAGERGVAYWTNLAMGRLRFEITPWTPLHVHASCSRLRAFEKPTGQASLYDTKTRGDLFELRADLRLNERWRGHVLGELFRPGGFYASHDDAWFLRAEIIASFAHIFEF